MYYLLICTTCYHITLIPRVSTWYYNILNTDDCFYNEYCIHIWASYINEMTAATSASSSISRNGLMHGIGIDTNVEVIVVSLTTWKVHHSPGARGLWWASLMRQQWPKLGYQFLFYHDETKLMMNKQILSIEMLKFVPKVSLVTAWLLVHILGSCDLIVSPS